MHSLLATLKGRRPVALTGAGCSTESGIPDYRGAGRPSPRNPIQHDAFLRDPAVRRRYWARSALGWPRFSSARPNSGHRALAELERAGLLTGVITQNVDGLHQRGGSRAVVELHGALDSVTCLDCRTRERRAELQERLVAANQQWLEARALVGALRPDGDAELAAEDVASFQTADCRHCGGPLKPDVVFFGGSVAEGTLTSAWSLFDAADALLVAGSSLTVYSGFRFVRRAAERGLPIAIINAGPTRGDELAAAKLEAPLGQVLPEIAAYLIADARVSASSFTRRSSGAS